MSGLPALRPSDDGDDERTTVVERTAPAEVDDERTTVVERTAPAEVDDERTTVVERTAPAAADDDHNETVVVARSAGDGPAASAPGDHSETIIVARGDLPAVETADRAPAASASAPAAPAGRRGRRRITLPPVESGFGAEPVDAVGPGAVASYSPRAITPLPVPGPAVPLGADATRAPAPSMPSVGRRSRTFGVVAVGGFALACVVSVTGLAAIVVSLLR